ncbi:hypothetical protein NL487_30140, partial [Klebsiella pneumoniae]|nr:hypothetical protein [Klebsiella pneumoniae]
PAFGPPISVEDQGEGRSAEYRAVDLPILFYRDGQLSEIDTDYRCQGLTLFGLDIYRTEPIVLLRALLAADPEPLELL